MNENKWFQVMDMCSGGDRKADFDLYFIEAVDQAHAERRFTEETGLNPYDVACECCGPNFSVIGEYNSLEEATSYWRKDRSLEAYLHNDPDVKFSP